MRPDLKRSVVGLVGLLAACTPGEVRDGASALDAAAPEVAPSLDAGRDGEAGAPVDAATSDLTSPLDARDGSDAVELDAPVCDIAGDYSVTTAGMTAYFRFHVPAMTWLGASRREDLGAPSSAPFGEWLQTRTRIVLRNDPGTATGCSREPAEYRLVFDPSCAQMTWHVVADDCAARARGLDGQTFARL